MFELNSKEKSCVDSINSVLNPEGVTILAYDYETPQRKSSDTYNIRLSVGILGNQKRGRDVFKIASGFGSAVKLSEFNRSGFFASFTDRQTRQDFLATVNQKIPTRSPEI